MKPDASVASIIASAMAPPTSMILLRVRMSPSRKAAVSAPTQMTMKKVTPC